MDGDLQAILLRDNPWLQNPDSISEWFKDFMPQEYYPRAVSISNRNNWKKPDRVHLIVGPRQAGKTTMIWDHFAASGKPVLFVDCEQGLIRQWCKSAPLFLEELNKQLGKPVALFFDEIQHLEEAGLFLKGLIDRKIGVPVLVSGSGAFHLNSKTRESLAGRATRTVLLPFSFSEVTLDLKGALPIVFEKESEKRASRHFVYGGYPEAWTGENPGLLLTELVDAIVMRDASDFYKIARPDAFRKLLKIAAGQVGHLVNLSEWAAISGVARDTVASYLEILESAHVMKMLPPFVGKKRSELTGRPKAFFFDNGIRNQLVGDFNSINKRADAGQIMENWVFGELVKNIPRDASLQFWRSTSGAEVDFVVQRGKSLVAVEVKAGSIGRPKVPRSARSFIGAYKPRILAIVNADLNHELKVGDTKVVFIKPWELGVLFSYLD